MVVDDEMSILDFLQRLLTEQGYKVETIDRAHAALERLHSKSYDLILLDIKLPIMNGMEFYRRIEQIRPELARKVIFITGDTMEKTTRDFLDSNKACYIAKPLDLEQLKSRINRVLTRQ